MSDRNDARQAESGADIGAEGSSMGSSEEGSDLDDDPRNSSAGRRNTDAFDEVASNSMGVHPPTNIHGLGTQQSLQASLGHPQSTGRNGEATSAAVDQIVRLLSGDGHLQSAVLPLLAGMAGTHNNGASYQPDTPSTDYTINFLSQIAAYWRSAHAIGQAAIPPSGNTNGRVVNQAPTVSHSINQDFSSSLPPATETLLRQLLLSSNGQSSPQSNIAPSTMTSSTQPSSSVYW